jgi:hypothetical protein
MPSNTIVGFIFEFQLEKEGPFRPVLSFPKRVSSTQTRPRTSIAMKWEKPSGTKDAAVTIVGSISERPDWNKGLSCLCFACKNES